MAIADHDGHAQRPLLRESATNGDCNGGDHDNEEKASLSVRTWAETKKLWHIVGPAIFSRVAAYTMNVVTQAFAGQLGEVELAAMSIANTVIVGFNFGLLVSIEKKEPPTNSLIRYSFDSTPEIEVIQQDDEDRTELRQCKVFIELIILTDTIMLLQKKICD